MSVDNVTLKYVLRRCKGQFARPAGVSSAAERAAMDAGLLVFHEWPSGHYQLTEKGRSFLLTADEEATS